MTDNTPPEDPGNMLEIGTLMLSENMGPMIGLVDWLRDMPVPEQLMILSRFVWMLNRYQTKLEEGSTAADALLFDIFTKQNRRDMN